MKGFTAGLALKQRRKETQKSLVIDSTRVNETTAVNLLLFFSWKI